MDAGLNSAETHAADRSTAAAILGRSPRLAAIGGSLIAGVFIAIAAIPLIATTLPNDLARNRTILFALHGAPRIVVFGDSRAEAAVDGRQLSRELPRSPKAYNLATHSQTLVQSYLFQQQMPPTVRIVVQFVTPENLGGTSALDSNVFNSMYLYGYRPSRQTRTTLARCFGNPLREEMEASDFRQRFESRWVLRQAIDSAVRAHLRTDLALQREQDDLYFPTPYTRRIPGANFALELSAAKSRGVGPMAPCQRCVIDAMIADARKSGRRLLFVFTPIHPGARHDGIQRELAAAIRARGAGLLDLSAALEDSDFIDPLHAGAAGAAKITSRIARELAGTR